MQVLHFLLMNNQLLCREVINKWLLDSGSAALQLLSHSSSRDPEKGGHLPLLPPPAYATDPPIPGICAGIYMYYMYHDIHTA